MDKKQTAMTPKEILQKHEDANEYHFHDVDRKWIIEAMEEYAVNLLTSKTVECHNSSNISDKEKSEKAINLTAVEWLVKQMRQPNWMSIPTTEWINQAKQMEKEQMQKLIIWMYKVSADQPMRFETDIDDIVEQYYNETYEKETDCH